VEGSIKKTTIVHVLRVLYNYTSYDYPATQTAIVNYLNDLDIACTRKTVGRNIRYLIESGVPIKRRMPKNGGYYYDHKNDRFFAKIKRTEEKK
jgi:predicted transcriptional regulator